MAVSENFKPSYKEKMQLAHKGSRTLHRVTFNPNKAMPGETLYVTVPKLDNGVALVPGSLSLVFNLVVSGHANNYLVNKVCRPLVSSLVVKFSEEKLQDTNAFD